MDNLYEVMAGGHLGQYISSHMLLIQIFCVLQCFYMFNSFWCMIYIREPFSYLRYKWFPNEAHRTAGFGVPPTRRRANDERDGRHQWGGGGQRLGD